MTTDERVMSLFERANPVPDPTVVTPPTRASSYLDTIKEKSSTMTLTTTEAESTQRKGTKRPWLMVAAAVTAAIALVAGLIIAGTRSDEEPVPADQPEPTVPVDEPEPTVPAVEPEPEVEATPAPDLEGDATDTEIVPSTVVDVAAASVAVGDQLVAAIEARDPVAAVQLISETPLSVDVFSAGDRGEFERIFGWFEAVDWQFQPQGCEFVPPDQVRCMVLQSNAWSEAVAGAPIEGTFFLKVENEQITAIRYGFDTGEWTVLALGPFRGFVQVNHLDDVADMWGTSPEGAPTGPLLTDRSFALFAQYTTEYVAEVTGQ